MASDSEFDSQQDENIITQGKSWKQFIWSPRGAFFVIACLLLVCGIIWNGHFGTFDIDKMILAGFFMILAIVISVLYEAWLKYRSPQAVWNGGHASICGDFADGVEGYFIAPLGGTDTTGWMKTAGSEATLIAPRTAVTTQGKNFVINVRPENLTIDELPWSAVQYCIANKMPPPYKLGYLSEAQLLNDLDDKYLEKMQKDDPKLVEELFCGVKRVDLMTLVNTLITQNRTINALKRAFRGDTRMMEQTAQVGKRLHEYGSKKKKESLFGDDEEE